MKLSFFYASCSFTDHRSSQFPVLCRSSLCLILLLSYSLPDLIHICMFSPPFISLLSWFQYLTWVIKFSMPSFKFMSQSNFNCRLLILKLSICFVFLVVYIPVRGILRFFLSVESRLRWLMLPPHSWENCPALTNI